MQLTAFTDTMLEIVADHLSMNVTDVKFNNLYLKNQTAMDGQVLKDCHIRDMFTCECILCVNYMFKYLKFYTYFEA